MHAAGVLLTHGDRALFLKRSDKSRDHAGEWCCPGGSLEEGETAEQAAARELSEETSLISGDLSRIDEGNGFVTFRQSVEDEPTPTLNDEHTEAMWAPLSDPPQPLHPGVAATLAKLLGTMLPAAADSPDASVAMAQDKREYDTNGWYEVLDNPLSGVGVFEYSEASVVKGGDPRKMVGVYRSAEELSAPECVNSFKLMPWTDDHPDAMLGDESKGLVPAEKKGIHGVIGEKVYYRDGILYGNIKVFSQTLARKIAEGKRELSVGYYCQFLPSEGVYEGTPYQYVQRVMRGNHLSSVRRGKMGDSARVMDAVEICALSFALDLKEIPSPAPRQDEMDCTLDAETQAFIADSFNSLVGELERKGYSKQYATKVAGKVAAEKGMTGHDSTLSTSIGDTTVADKTEEQLKKEAGDRKAARDAKRTGMDSMRAKDGLTAEEEEGMDAQEASCDAEEEKDDEKDESKDAMARGRARDRRAGARDARKGARDKMARDSKGKGMDAAAVTALVDGRLAAMDAKVSGIKVPSMDEIVSQVRPQIRKEEAAKAALYGKVSPIVGAFDHSEMTHVDMATYALDKLGAPKAEDPVMALDFFLAGRTQSPAAVQQRDSALDAAPPEGSFLRKYLDA